MLANDDERCTGFFKFQQSPCKRVETVLSEMTVAKSCAEHPKKCVEFMNQIEAEVLSRQSSTRYDADFT